MYRKNTWFQGKCCKSGHTVTTPRGLIHWIIWNHQKRICLPFSSPCNRGVIFLSSVSYFWHLYNPNGENIASPETGWKMSFFRHNKRELLLGLPRKHQDDWSLHPMCSTNSMWGLSVASQTNTLKNQFFGVHPYKILLEVRVWLKNMEPSLHVH